MGSRDARPFFPFLILFSVHVELERSLLEASVHGGLGAMPWVSGTPVVFLLTVGETARPFCGAWTVRYFSQDGHFHTTLGIVLWLQNHLKEAERTSHFRNSDLLETDSSQTLECGRPSSDCDRSPP